MRASRECFRPCLSSPCLRRCLLPAAPPHGVFGVRIGPPRRWVTRRSRPSRAGRISRMIYSIQTGPNVFFQKLSPDKTVPSLELTKGGPPPAYLKTKPISDPLESDSDKYKHKQRPASKGSAEKDSWPGQQKPRPASSPADENAFAPSDKGRQGEISHQPNGAQTLAPPTGAAAEQATVPSLDPPANLCMERGNETNRGRAHRCNSDGDGPLLAPTVSLGTLSISPRY